MAVDNPTVVQEASTASHEWKNVNAQVSALLASILQRTPKDEGQEQGQDTEGQDPEAEGQEKPKAKEKPRSIEIQVGKNKVFKGTEGQEPKKNTLTPAQVTALEKLVNTPSTEAGQELDSSVQSLGRVVTVRVDNEPVLRVANGQLENKLAPEPQQERTPEPSIPQPVSQPSQTPQPSQITADQSSARFPQIPDDFGIQAAKGINSEKVLATGDNLLSRSYLSLEAIRQDLNDSYRRGSEPGFEFIAKAPHVAPLRERFEAEKINFESRLNTAIEQGKYKTSEAQVTAQTAPKQATPQQTAPQPISQEKVAEIQAQIQAQTQVETQVETQAEAKLEPEVIQSEAQPQKYITSLPEIPEDFGLPDAQGMTGESAEKLGGERLRTAFEALNEQRNNVHEVRILHVARLNDPEQSPSEYQTHHVQSYYDSKLMERYDALKQDFSKELQSALEKQGRQIEPENAQAEKAQADPTQKRSFGETLSKDLAKSFDLPPETKEYFRETGAAIKESAKAAWAKLKVKAKETAIAGVNQAKTQLYSRQAANTAVQLLNSDPTGRSFKGEDYNITAVNRHTISVTDAEQKEILRFEETPLGPKILKSELTPKQLKEFAQVRGQLQKHGTENLLGTQPTARMQYLQGFAPQGDRAQVQKIHNDNTISRVEKIAQTLKPTAVARNSETHELGDYSIERKGDNFEVRHQERGVILSRTNGEVQGNLSDRDIAHFRGLASRTAELVPVGQQQSPVAAVATPAPNTLKPKSSKKPEMEMGD
ncbi:MAG: hypothetical protein MH252_12845 [Thermosynechococcaceae cyanobacterium MS004]|nr:hypothetical protein [Thermosynechococcaceae cyanobacterium MS004]